MSTLANSDIRSAVSRALRSRPAVNRTRADLRARVSAGHVPDLVSARIPDAVARLLEVQNRLIHV
jgi:hypothetical protein